MYYGANKDVLEEKAVMKVSRQTLKFDEIVVNKICFDASKKGIALDLVESSNIIVSDKFKHSQCGFKHFIGYLHVDHVVKPLCIIIPPVSRYIKYFSDGKKKICQFELKMKMCI